MIVFITELNDNNFKNFIQNDLVLIDVWADWCAPCKAISPIIDELSVEFHGTLSVGKLDADSNRDIVSDLSVRNIPAIFLYKNGEIVDKSVGNTTKEELINMINTHK